MIKHCYIHIPFCDKICSYCDFCKILKNDFFIDNYLDALKTEIEEIYQNEELETIYIGGGTPSSLSLKQLEKLFNILSKLKKKKKIEYTIEGNFENTTKEKLELYKKVGINRLSFGLESTIPKNLVFLNRELSKEKVEKIIKDAKELGFTNVNIDLMYALPTETLIDLEKDIDYILSLQIQHISTYSLIIEKNTLLDIKKQKNIEEDIDYEMYKLICQKLKEKNYLHYEISNFSKEGYESQHNLTYWNNEPYYGFGLGASSYINNKRIENTRSLNDYLKGKRIKNIETISLKDKVEYEILLNLRKKEGISLKSFQEKYHQELKDFYSYEELLKEGLLRKNNEHLFIPENKWYISNEIIVRLLERQIYE